jgi:hypothetical protein
VSAPELAVVDRGYASLLRRPRFRFFFFSQTTGDAGYAVYSISVLWLAFRLTGSVFVAGLVLFVEFGIYSLSFVAGPFVDRVRDLRSVLLIGYPLQAIGAAVIGFALAAGVLSVGLLLGLVVGISFLWTFTWTATNAMVPHLVGEGELLRANALVSAIGGSNQIAGFAAGGALILVVGPAGGAFLYAGLNALAAILSIPVSVPQARPERPASVGAEFADGWRFLANRENRAVLDLSLWGMLQGFLSTAPLLLITLLAGTVFADPSLSYASLFTAFAVGGIVGSLALGHFNPRRWLTVVLAGTTALEGALVLVAVRAAPQLLASVGLWFAVGLVDLAFYTAFIAYIQASTPRAMMGRTLTNTYVFRGSARAVGAVLVGALAGVLAPIALGEVTALTLVAVGVTGPFLFPAVRSLRF